MTFQISKNALKKGHCMKGMEKLESGQTIVVWLIQWPILCF